MEDDVPPPRKSSPTESSSAQFAATNNDEPENFAFTNPPSTSETSELGDIRISFRKKASACSSLGNKKPLLQKQKNSPGMKRIKCVLIGDSKTGKTALVRCFLQPGQNSTDYVPTTRDDHVYTTYIEKNATSSSKAKQESGAAGNHKNDGKNEISLQICDTGGQEEMDRLRPLCYGQAQMVIICFSVMNPNSFENVTMKWLPEVKRHCMVKEDPNNPLKLLLVGTQSDLRSNVNMLLKLMDDGQAPISETQALKLANKIGALNYVESSAVTCSNVNHIFHIAAKYGEGKTLPRQITGFELDVGFQGKCLSNITEKKLLFWRRWRGRQNKSSKMKRLVIWPCLF